MEISETKSKQKFKTVLFKSLAVIGLMAVQKMSLSRITKTPKIAIRLLPRLMMPGLITQSPNQATGSPMAGIMKNSDSLLLTQINRESVDRLGLAFELDLGSNDALEATPIVVDNTMFFTSTFSIVHAVDAKTGVEKWRYDPMVPKDYRRRLCCGPINRGVAVYQGKVYVGTLDGRLVAIDAGSGEKVWEVNTIIDTERNYSITGAPRAAKGKIFIGNGGAEFGVRGYVTAYDSETGEEVWRFFTVPGRSLPAL